MISTWCKDVVRNSLFHKGLRLLNALPREVKKEVNEIFNRGKSIDKNGCGCLNIRSLSLLLLM